VYIRKVDSKGKVSMLISEVNKAAIGNAVLYRYYENDSLLRADGIEGMFQLVHVNLKTLGSRITFDRFNCVCVLLKHVVSGKFLIIDELTKRLVLSKDFDEMIDTIKSNKKRIESEYSDKFSAFVRLKELKKNEDITKKDSSTLTQNDIDFMTTNGKQLLGSEDDYYKAYIMMHTFILEKVSSDESMNMNNSTFFKIRTASNKHLQTSKDDDCLNQQLQKEVNDDEANFVNNYYREMRTKFFHDVVVEREEFDVFHLEKRDKQTMRIFNMFNSYTPFLCKTLHTAEVKQFLVLQFMTLLEDLLAQCRQLATTKQLSKPQLQSLLHQMGVVDVLMGYLIKMKVVSKENEDIVGLICDSCSISIKVLQYLCFSPLR
jgi:hypothetical protein